MNLPSVIHLYDGTRHGELDMGELVEFLRRYVPSCTLDVRTDVLTHWLPEPIADDAAFGLARRLAATKVRQPDAIETRGDPTPGEIAFERRFLTTGAEKPSGIVYDGVALMAIYAGLMHAREPWPEHGHIVLTRQLVGTWSEDDLRWHARTSVYGLPSIVSTTGLVAAPAKPREYYLAQQLGMDPIRLEREFAGRFLVQDDPRLREAVKGYLLQAVFHHATGDPFCADRDCRLFNAHWQEELLHAQLRPGADLCPRHRRLLDEL